MKRRDVRFNMVMQEREYSALKRLAADRGISASDLVRQWVHRGEDGLPVAKSSARRFWEQAFVVSYPRAQRRADECSADSVPTARRAQLAAAIAKDYADAALAVWKKRK